MPSRRLTWLLLAVAGVAVYGGSLGGGFLNWDDDRFVSANPLFAGPVPDYVKAALTRVQFEAYHPLHLLSYLPDRLLWPSQPLGFRLLSLALLVVGAGLLAEVARRVASPLAALLAGLLLVAHPLAVEPTAWISCRKDLLALGLTAAVLLAEDRGEGRRPSGLGLVLFGAALLAKTSTVAAPAVLFAYLWLLRRRPAAEAALRAAPYAALAVAASLAVVAIWRGHEMIPAARPAPLAVDVGATVGTYLVRILAPVDLAPIYPEAPAHPELLAGLAAAVVLGVLLGWRRLPRAARFAALATLAALAPVANVVPVVFRFADRYAFLALGLLVVPVAALLDVGLARRRRLTLAVTAAAILVAGVGAGRQASMWRSSASLWDRAVAAQPRAYLAHLKRGETLRDAGQGAAAVAAYQAAIRLDPRRALGYAGLFHAYAVAAERDGALSPGTAARWLAALGPALADRETFVALQAEVAPARCPRCATTLLLLGLKRFPRSDDELRAGARRALDGGAPAAALVWLSQLAAPTEADAELAAEASRPR